MEKGKGKSREECKKVGVTIEKNEKRMEEVGVEGPGEGKKVVEKKMGKGWCDDRKKKKGRMRQ